MTRARTLKQTIRARAAKTGERYTTARRHVLRALGSVEPVSPTTTRTEPPARSPAPDAATSAAASPAGSETGRARAGAVVSRAKSAVSDARVRERTGHDLAHWFGVLDRFGAVDKGHTAAARHLREAHGVDGWYAQGITVAYERARGLRDVNQRTSGLFEVSVSKVLAADVGTVVAAITSTRRRARWTKTVDPALARALGSGTGARRAPGFTTKANGDARCRYRWDGTAVEVYVQPTANNRSSIVVAHSKLPSRAALEERRRQWRQALGALADYLNT